MLQMRVIRRKLSFSCISLKYCFYSLELRHQCEEEDIVST